ncbi:MAG: alanine racemase, partial [Lachnospiraceae bacterium]|nr:alanine racemase [Lachnospiraceae bacterium]
DKIEHNFNVIKNSVSHSAKLCCVVKADAYGHGSPELSAFYERLGADFFAVSNLEEALEVRSSGVTRPILILGYTPADWVKELADNNISQTVFSLEYGKELADAAVRLGVTVKVHIKIDTGMSRIGFMCQDVESDDAPQQAYKVFKLDGLKVEGIFTHFAVADEKEEGREYTEHQLECFGFVIDSLRKRGVETDKLICHCANSAAIMDYPNAHINMVRAGIILYGLAPSGKLRGQLDLQPAMEIKSVVAHIKEIKAGTTVSYGRTFTAEKNMKIATVPIGYADGYIRNLSGNAYMSVGGVRAKVVGRICMDQCMLDVSYIDNVKVGDTVTVIGSDGSTEISTDEVASWTGTINYEVVCLVGKRVPRVYIQNDEVTGVKSLI